MQEIEKIVSQLPSETQKKIEEIFGSFEKFYATLYLIAKNEHLTKEEKADQWESRLRVIHAYQERIQYMLDRFNIPGKDIMADITSDYLEDYVNYREKDFGMSNEEFIRIIKRIG